MNGGRTAANSERKNEMLTTIKKGETYTTASGHKLTVTEIEVNMNFLGGVSTTIFYDYETTDGRKGSERCSPETIFTLLEE